MSETVAALLGLEQQLRKASDLAQLSYTLVNQAGRCVPYVQAVLLLGGPQHQDVVAASDIPTIDYTSPYISWIERLVKALGADSDSDSWQQRILTPDDCPENLADEWRAMELPPWLLWQPLSIDAREGEVAGVLLLFNERKWTEPEQGVSQHLAASAGHAVFALRRHNPFKHVRPWLKRKRTLAVALVAMAAVLSIPVNLSVLAPVEVIPRDPLVVASPLNGVVEKVTVEPNQPVAAGDMLASIEDDELASQAGVAEQAFLLAQAELKTVQQSGFMDPRQKARLAELESQVNLRRAEWNYARARLARTQIEAAAGGVVMLDDPDAWKGRPVKIGERIMLVADPEQVEFEIMLPVKDAISLVPGADVRVFLDRDPLNAIDARLKHAGYEPRETAEQQMAYRLVASLEESEALPRLGLRGTAKVYGEQVSLFFYLFRRPITAARQWLGW